MIGDQGVRLTPDDDDFHRPTTDDPMWSETTWFSFCVPERRLRLAFCGLLAVTAVLLALHA